MDLNYILGGYLQSSNANSPVDCYRFSLDTLLLSIHM